MIEVIGILLGLAILVGINAYGATLMKKVGINKGYGAETHIWAICFWLGIIGYLYVIALPDKIAQSQNQKIIKLLEEEK
jgi:hypothetical protein